MISGDMSVSEFRTYCDIIEFNGEEFWSYQGGEWETPDQLNPIHGYYVFVENDCSLALDETTTSGLISDDTLTEGWNMFSTLEEASFDDLETDCEGVENEDENIIWRFNPGDEEWETFDDSHTLQPDEGYFIKIEDTCQIEHTEHN